MKKVLLPTDFSANAWNAITYALEFFKNDKCSFYILNTYSPAFYRMDYAMGGPAFSGIPDPMIDNSMLGLENTLKDIKKRFPNPKHQFHTLSAFNILTDEINEVVEREDIDMVIMGTQGATGAKEVLFGSNTVFVMRKSNVPVLAIPEGYRFKEIKSILFPTDYLTFYKRREVKPLVEITKMCKAKLTVLHVVEEFELSEKQEVNKEFLDECLEGVDHEFKEIRKQYMPNAVQEYIAGHDYDMLAMMNRKHSFLERLLLRQNVDSIGFHIKIPFLVMRDTAKISK
ncbi:universal stress protein [Sungkyunkwania multivorans]|uniref:Universal stress protein n=1 Tax=Sungkyunkwania multivorans TaxID=1173618 RepID=A0ABW3D2M4_9FLAO